MKRLALIVLEVIVLFGALRFYQFYRTSSPTPSDAVNDYIIRIKSNSPQKLESLEIVSSTELSSRGNEQLLLFQANDTGLQSHIAGYATIKKSPLGWYVDRLQMVGTWPLPADLMANLDWSGDRRIPVVYGQVFLSGVASVEVVFSDPNQGDVTISADSPKGIFAVFGTPYSELTTFKILDAKGNVLKQFTREEMENR
ncbi:MAG: hypothetical protein EHM33_17530 [Chloroflexi bacterium]|nr:MAG: hypothetical protein EHM33_17530 [Chloroflexota bacterium]